jgi:hypothetical protein
MRRTGGRVVSSDDSLALCVQKAWRTVATTFAGSKSKDLAAQGRHTVHDAILRVGLPVALATTRTAPQLLSSLLLFLLSGQHSKWAERGLIVVSGFFR